MLSLLQTALTVVLSAAIGLLMGVIGGGGGGIYVVVLLFFLHQDAKTGGEEHRFTCIINWNCCKRKISKEHAETNQKIYLLCKSPIEIGKGSDR